MSDKTLLKEICKKNNVDEKVINLIIEEEKKEVYKKYRNIKGTLKSIIETNVEGFHLKGGINNDN